MMTIYEIINEIDEGEALRVIEACVNHIRYIQQARERQERESEAKRARLGEETALAGAQGENPPA